MNETPNLTMSVQLVLDIIAEAIVKSECSQFHREQFEIERLPQPEPGIIHIEKHHARNIGIPEGTHWVWFITRSDPQSVFFDEQNELFGCCWGPDQETGNYADLGFRGNDPVEMYLV